MLESHVMAAVLRKCCQNVKYNIIFLVKICHEKYKTHPEMLIAYMNFRESMNSTSH